MQFLALIDVKRAVSILIIEVLIDDGGYLTEVSSAQTFACTR